MLFPALILLQAKLASFHSMMETKNDKSVIGHGNIFYLGHTLVHSKQSISIWFPYGGYPLTTIHKNLAREWFCDVGEEK